MMDSFMSPELEYWLTLALVPLSVLLLFVGSQAWEAATGLYHSYKAKRAPFWWDVPADNHNQSPKQT